MARTAATYGYAGASVSRVCEAAGVPRGPFYEHFRDREDCFLASYGCALDAMQAAYVESRTARPEADFGPLIGLFEAADADRSAARLLLVEAFAGPPALRASHHDRMLDLARAMLEKSLWPLRIPPAALQGGVLTVAADALVDEGRGPLTGLLPGLTAWLSTYAAPSARSLGESDWDALGRSFGAHPVPGAGSPDLSPLPRGRSALPAAASAADRRRRIVEATCEVVAGRGYAKATVADVVATARVSRAAFYSHFQCKQDAFLTALTAILQESVALAAGQFFLGEDWPDRVWRGLCAFLRYIAARPHAARLGMVEIYSVGVPALTRTRENRLAFTLFLADGYQQSEAAERLPAICSEAIAGSVEGMIRHWLLTGRATRVLELLPQCAYVALAPFIGPSAALDFVRSKPVAVAPGP